jgi:hypothetical protein
MWGDPQVKVSGWVGPKFIYLDAQIPEPIDHQGCIPGIKYASQGRR